MTTDHTTAYQPLAVLGDADLLAEFERRWRCPDECGGDHGGGDWDHAIAVLRRWRGDDAGDDG